MEFIATGIETAGISICREATNFENHALMAHSVLPEGLVALLSMGLGIAGKDWAPPLEIYHTKESWTDSSYAIDKIKAKAEKIEYKLIIYNDGIYADGDATVLKQGRTMEISRCIY